MLILIQLAGALRSTARQDAQIDMLTKNLTSLTDQVEARGRKSEEAVQTQMEKLIERLITIDKAQAKIAELSGSVVSLQEVLADKRSRGAFGEVQLNALISNILPPNSYAFQYTFPNGVRADCVLILPPPTGTVCIDSKFPLENFQKMTDISQPESERRAAETQFKADIRKHIKDIAGKYIIPGATADGAMMFIPAEAVFAEIHAHHPDLVQEAQRARVWMASPTTMMAVLTTANAVLKDEKTRKQVHIIQEHLNMLAKDFSRFQTRMDSLAKRIDLANTEVSQVQTSARKITSRFSRIEKVDLSGERETLPADGDEISDQPEDGE
ncbi:MAG: DNA recombination protein RmuC [Kiritimatiellales bacterium]